MNEGGNIRGYGLEVYRDQEDGSWVAEVPDLPGCLAAGESIDEAIEMVADAIEAWIETAKADGRAVPGPRVIDEDYSGRTLLRMPKSLHRRVAAAARHDGVSLNTYCVMTLSEAVSGFSGIPASYSMIRGSGLATNVYLSAGYGATTALTSVLGSTTSPWGYIGDLVALTSGK